MNKTMKWTPGPWRWQGEDYRGGWGWQILVDAEGRGIAVGQGLNGGPEPRLRAHIPVEAELCITGMMAHGRSHVEPFHVMEAAAPLIAAAPDLYAALDAALAEHFKTDGMSLVSEHWSNAARAALAKARGEQP